MRVVVYDTNVPSNVVYNLEDLKKNLKNLDMIPLLKDKTSEARIKEMDRHNYIGFVENISIHKGVFRGDLIMDDAVKKDYSKLVENHLKNKKIHMALKIDGIKKNDIIEVSKIKEIYYLYLN